MPMGILFYVLLFLAVLALFFGSAYPFAFPGFVIVELFLVGWKVFGPPLQ